MEYNKKEIKVLNLYAGIGGNRKLWGDNLKITAVEMNEKIAQVYADFWPKDELIIGDAHQYLLDHYHEYDVIWSSPPCPSHSITNSFLNAQGIIRYPDMSLYQEIIFLKHFFKGKWVVENVKAYYDPLIKPQVAGRHWFWANFKIPPGLKSHSIGRMAMISGGMRGDDRNSEMDKFGFDLSGHRGINREKVLRNCVTPEIGLKILEAAINSHVESNLPQLGLFNQIKP